MEKKNEKCEHGYDGDLWCTDCLKNPKPLTNEKIKAGLEALERIGFRQLEILNSKKQYGKEE